MNRTVKNQQKNQQKKEQDNNQSVQSLTVNM